LRPQRKRIKIGDPRDRRMTTSITATAASVAVFNTTELLEQILLYLPTNTL